LITLLHFCFTDIQWQDPAKKCLAGYQNNFKITYKVVQYLLHITP